MLRRAPLLLGSLSLSLLAGCATNATSETPGSAATLDGGPDASRADGAAARPSDGGAKADGKPQAADGPAADAGAKDPGSDASCQGDASSCVTLQSVCQSTCDCCDTNAVCSQVGGLLVDWCCMPVGRACNDDNDCCGQALCSDDGDGGKTCQ